MTSLLKNLGVILVLAGVICLIVYYFAMPSNALLVCSIVLELIGIATYIFMNKKFD